MVPPSSSASAKIRSAADCAAGGIEASGRRFGHDDRVQVAVARVPEDEDAHALLGGDRADPLDGFDEARARHGDVLDEGSAECLEGRQRAPPCEEQTIGCRGIRRRLDLA